MHGDFIKLKGSYINPIHQHADILSSVGIGHQGHLDMTLCLECGTVQGTFPKEIPEAGQFTTLGRLLPEFG